ncbi:hypothetical protein L3V79_08395 [Thiotrichales bacterium 19S9-12]|nr:hypothetical protein [Thiotrichales bacterium 19S9-11]MCF6812373.1 hypothetical protein [Thiotrichales bacterium 19S9-12]
MLSESSGEELYIFFWGTMMKEADYITKCYFGLLIYMARKKVGPNNVLVFDGPGTFDDSHSVFEKIASVVGGGITGSHGPNSVNNNIDNAKAKIDSMNPRPKRVYAAGHSRGGPTGNGLTNDIFNTYGNEIEFHLMQFDPVPGLKATVSREDQIWIADSVKKCHIIIAEDCPIPYFTTLIPFHNDKKTEMLIYRVNAHHNEAIGLKLGMLEHDTLITKASILCWLYGVQALALESFMLDVSEMKGKGIEEKLIDSVLYISGNLSNYMYFKEGEKYNGSEKEVYWAGKVEPYFKVSALTNIFPKLQLDHIQHEKQVNDVHSELLDNSLHNQKALAIHNELEEKKEVPQTFYQSGMIINIGPDGNLEYQH